MWPDSKCTTAHSATGLLALLDLQTNACIDPFAHSRYVAIDLRQPDLMASSNLLVSESLQQLALTALKLKTRNSMRPTVRGQRGPGMDSRLRHTPAGAYPLG